MIVYRLKKDKIPERFQKAVVTMGNFDGVHRGHQALLKLTCEGAAAIGGQSIVLTFDPHPVQLFKPATFLLIQPLEARLKRLEMSGVDVCGVMEFTRDLADYSPRRFVEDWLLKAFELKHIIIGFDTTYGKGRKGSPEAMAAFGREFGFETTIVDAVTIGGRPVNSSRIRKALVAGRVEEANKLLGYPFEMRGTVVKGFSRGAALLGFPTANIQTGHRLIPGTGVYAVWVRRGPERHRGALNIGTNPTFGNQHRSIEVYILDFKEDVYGEQLSITFVKRLREERRFDGVEALRKQMARDVEEVGDVLR